MTDIIGTLELMKLQDGKWELLSNPIMLLDSGRTIKPHRGFIYDGGSVPQVFWSLGLTPVGSDGDYAFLCHDWLYSLSRSGATYFTRKEADEAMLELLLYAKVDPTIAYGAYTAVRAAAYPNWGDGQKDEHSSLLEDPEGFEWFRE